MEETVLAANFKNWQSSFLQQVEAQTLGHKANICSGREDTVECYLARTPSCVSVNVCVRAILERGHHDL